MASPVRFSRPPVAMRAANRHNLQPLAGGDPWTEYTGAGAITARRDGGQHRRTEHKEQDE